MCFFVSIADRYWFDRVAGRGNFWQHRERTVRFAGGGEADLFNAGEAEFLSTPSESPVHLRAHRFVAVGLEVAHR
jgi:hypothetical protein